MNINNYKDIYQHDSYRLNTLPFNICVYDINSSCTYQLNNNFYETNQEIILIYDPQKKDSPLNYPEQYYITSLEDLKTTISFIAAHPLLFTDLAQPTF